MFQPNRVRIILSLIAVSCIAINIVQSEDMVYDLDLLGTGDPIEEILAKADLDTESLKLPVGEIALRLMASTTLRSPGLFFTFAEHPLRISWRLLHYRQRIYYAKDYLRKIIMYMTARINVSLFRGYHSNPWRGIESELENAKNPILSSLEKIASHYDDPLTSAEREEFRRHIDTLPEELRPPLATILAFSNSSLRWHSMAFEEWMESRHKDAFFNLTEMSLFNSSNSSESPDIRKFFRLIDFPYLCAGAQDLCEGLDRAMPMFQNARPATTDTLSWQMNTPLGLILINWSDHDNQYEVPRGQNVFLLVDYSGNDTYFYGAANESTTQPISILIDFEGDDVYASRDRHRPCFGAGIGGYGALIDFDGDDHYVSGQFTQGATLFGMGLLWDKGGDDSYSALQLSQAAAIGGLALLYDESGEDRYHGYSELQGYGSTRGFGFLMDDDGDDTYICADDRLFSPSPQAPEHNNSLGQGVGKGFRSDLSDGHSVPGGIGMLLDEKGDDTYSAGVMAQGLGFWNGVGILMDMEGDDQYSGVYYVQGVGIHTAVGALCDYDGNDTYTAQIFIAQGSAHDFSVGYLLDAKGNDFYDSPPMSPGTANQNSIGIFLDREGNDRYATNKGNQSHGHAKMSKWGTPGEDTLNIGLFLDLNGDDRYPASRKVRNNSFWIQKSKHPHLPRLKSQWGLGLDGNFDRINVPLRPITPYTPDD